MQDDALAIRNRLRVPECVNDFETPRFGIYTRIPWFGDGELIQTWVGSSGGTGALLTKRSGLAWTAFAGPVPIDIEGTPG